MTRATETEIAEIDRLIKPQGPPERIYGWMYNQMSIARFYGGLKYMGHSYMIDASVEGTPLVRADVIAREVKAQREAAKAKRQAEKEAAQQAQGELL